MFADLLKLFFLLFNVILRIVCLITGFFIALSSINYVGESTIKFVTILLFGVWLTFQAVARNGPYKVLFMMGIFIGWIFGLFKYSNVEHEQKEKQNVWR